jgi:hypothetical protein
MSSLTKVSELIGLTNHRSIRIAVCTFGLLLFASNVLRDNRFYTDVFQNEGFDSTTDTFIVAVGHQALATVMLFPVAVFLICYGIGCCERFVVFPRNGTAPWVWRIIATSFAIMMSWIEFGLIQYCIRYVHHWPTLITSLLYLCFIYFWWCNSVSHGWTRMVHRSETGK